jgi:hypothetical protein
MPAAVEALLAGLFVIPDHAANTCRQQLATAEARWQLQHQQDSPGVLMEAFTLGWFNLLLQVGTSCCLPQHNKNLGLAPGGAAALLGCVSYLPCDSQQTAAALLLLCVAALAN